jgi:hypothetical protein
MDQRKAAPTARAIAWNPMALWASVLDLPRQQSAVATHAASALFSGCDAMRRIHERALQETMKYHSEAAQRLGGSCGPLELLSLQMDLARLDAQAAASYWQQMTDAALQTQACVAACGCELVDSDKVLEACAMLDGH